MIQALGLKEGLDIGCGTSTVLPRYENYRFKSTGIDADRVTIERAKTLNIHDDYILGDIRLLDLQRQYDVVVCTHVIEHLTREDGLCLLVKLEGIAEHLLYIETPNGFLAQSARDGNPFQQHLSGWYPQDFETRGYSVFGMSWRVLRGEEGRARLFPEAVTRSLERLTQSVPYHFPQVSHGFAALRLINRKENLIPV